MSADVVEVIEAAYAGERDDAAWMRRIAELSAPALDQGLGLMAGLYDVTGGPMRLDAVVGVGIDAATTEAIRGSNALGTPEDMTRMYRRGPTCSSGRVQSGMSTREWRRYRAIAPVEAATGLYDGVGVVSGDPSGIGCLLIAPVRGDALVPRAMCAVWTRIAAHLAAAVRLRREVGHTRPVEAVLSPSGRLEHAESPAQGADVRAALTDGAVRIDRARGSLRRRDPEEAVEIWRALVAGRWSLVDHFDHDGRRFLLARRNEPSGGTLAGLTAQEHEVLALAALGHTNKLIAYQLGLSPSAVAMRLSRVARTLGVRTRVQLIAAYQNARGDQGKP